MRHIQKKCTFWIKEAYTLVHYCLTLPLKPNAALKGPSMEKIFSNWADKSSVARIRMKNHK